MSYQYDKHAQEFDRGLSEFLSEMESEKAAEAAADYKPDDGLKRIATGKTPLDEVREIIESKKTKSAAEEIAEHEIRTELRKLSNQQRAALNDFLTAAKG